MNDSRFKELINEYVEAEMELLPKNEELPAHLPYSRKFDKKMKKITRTAEYFGGSIKLYNAFTRVAAVVFIIFSLMIVNQASAALFGFNPWNEIIGEYFPDVKMLQKTYVKNKDGQKNLKKPISDFPTYVPDGYNEKYRDIGRTGLGAEWEKTLEGGSTLGIAYGRDNLDEDTVFVEDDEYDSLKNTEVAGYAAKIIFEPEQVRIQWIDENYYYCIWTSDVKDGESTVKAMADSIYEKN